MRLHKGKNWQNWQYKYIICKDCQTCQYNYIIWNKTNHQPFAYIILDSGSCFYSEISRHGISIGKIEKKNSFFLKMNKIGFVWCSPWTGIYSFFFHQGKSAKTKASFCITWHLCWFLLTFPKRTKNIYDYIQIMLKSECCTPMPKCRKLHEAKKGGIYIYYFHDNITAREAAFSCLISMIVKRKLFLLLHVGKGGTFALTRRDKFENGMQQSSEKETS